MSQKVSRLPIPGSVSDHTPTEAGGPPKKSALKSYFSHPKSFILEVSLS